MPHYYCPRGACGWEGHELPPGQACPRCKAAVEPYAPDGNPSDRPASQHVGLDREAWQRRGEEKYDAFVLRLAKMLREKQHAYGDSFGNAHKVLEILYPSGIPVEQYQDVLTVTRIIDKLFRVANQKNYGGENPYVDIAGYATMAACDDEETGVATTLTDDDQGPIDLV